MSRCKCTKCLDVPKEKRCTAGNCAACVRYSDQQAAAEEGTPLPRTPYADSRLAALEERIAKIEEYLRMSLKARPSYDDWAKGPGVVPLPQRNPTDWPLPNPTFVGDFPPGPNPTTLGTGANGTGCCLCDFGFTCPSHHRGTAAG